MLCRGRHQDPVGVIDCVRVGRVGMTLRVARAYTLRANFRSAPSGSLPAERCLLLRAKLACASPQSRPPPRFDANRSNPYSGFAEIAYCPDRNQRSVGRRAHSPGAYRVARDSAMDKAPGGSRRTAGSQRVSGWQPRARTRSPRDLLVISDPTHHEAQKSYKCGAMESRSPRPLRTSRGLDPSGGPSTPAACNWSIIRAARP